MTDETRKIVERSIAADRALENAQAAVRAADDTRQKANAVLRKHLRTLSGKDLDEVLAVIDTAMEASER